MDAPTSIVVLNSRHEPAALCRVCGKDVPAGEGLTVRYGERTVRFKCPGCLIRFEADPERYLAGGIGRCCGNEHSA